MWSWFCGGGHAAVEVVSKPGNNNNNQNQNRREEREARYANLCSIIRPSVGTGIGWYNKWSRQSEDLITNGRSRVFGKPYMIMNTVVMNGVLKALHSEGSIADAAASVTTTGTTTDAVSKSPVLNIRVTSLPAILNPPQAVETLMILLTLIFTPLAIMLGFPTLINNIIVEKNSRLVMMIEIQGGKLIAYWAATYLYHFMFYNIFAMFYLFVLYGTGIAVFQSANIFLLFMVFFVWGHAVVAYGIFLSALLSSPITSAIMGYMFIISHSLAGIIFFQANLWPDASLSWLPSYHFLKALVEILKSGGSVNVSLIWGQIGMMFLTGCLFLVVGIGIHAVRLLWQTGRLPPLASFLDCSICGRAGNKKKIGICTKGTSNKQVDNGGGVVEMTAVENGAGGQHFIDSDVLAERELTEKQLPQDVGIKVMHLEKLFPPRPRCPPKLAVADLSFHVKYNEVFGLLGKVFKK
tara:strand:- start:837 stop:2231 length:1395 start_codon:yes stop_codon:yes gene_type:complete